MTKEKKKTILLTVILSVVCIVLICFFAIDLLKQNGTIIDEETKELMDDFEEYFNSKEKAVIYYASSSCGYCELQSPILETIAEDYDVDYLEIDSTKLGSNQTDEILEKLDIEHATPTTIIVQNGEVIDKAIGYTDGQDYIEFFANNKIIPQDAVYSKESSLTFIDYDEYEDLISEEDTHIVVIGQTTCSHCIAIKPALNSVAKEYDLTINYLNLTKMTEEQSDDFNESLTTIEYNDPDFVESGSFGTPLTLIIKDGKVTNYISGQRTKSQLVREFKKAGLISE